MLAKIVARDRSEFELQFKTIGTPQLVFEEVRVHCRNGNTGYIVGAHKWVPFAIVADGDSGAAYQQLINASPFRMIFEDWNVEECWLMDEGDEFAPLIWYRHATKNYEGVPV